MKVKYNNQIASTVLFLLFLWGATFYLTLPGDRVARGEYAAVSAISLLLIDAADYMFIAAETPRRAAHLFVGFAVLLMIFARLY